MLRRMFEELHKVFFGLRKVAEFFISHANAQEAVPVGRRDLQAELEGGKRPLIIATVISLGACTGVANGFV